jgi:hypothetical protein
MSGDVFVSYSRRDQEFVLRLVRDLEDRKALAWIDQGDIQGGEQWRQSIAVGVQSCKVFVLVVSPDSIKSAYVAEELALAFQYRKPVIPLIYRRTTIPAILSAQLQNYQFLDFRRGGYAQNLADLIGALARQGVTLQTDAGQSAQRRHERLGAPIKTPWGAVFSRIPGWAFAWGLGWAIFWLVLPIVLSIVAKSEIKNFAALPIGGFVGGVSGGLLAGLFTMLALRHHAISIRWKHMSPSIRTWGLVGPIGAIVAGVVAFAGLSAAAPPSCTGLSFGDCLGKAFGTAIGTAILTVLVALFYSLIAVFAIGAVAGWLAVRHIRRLEPGILGRQAIWVLIGWGGGAIASALVTLTAISMLGG